MLCNMMEDNQETSYPYWPTKEEETIKYGKIVVTMQSKAAYGDFGVRKFNLREDKVCGLSGGIKRLRGFRSHHQNCIYLYTRTCANVLEYNFIHGSIIIHY